MTAPALGEDPNDPYATRIAEATDTVTLADGRTLAYCEFGDPDGAPVFVFHGGVGSRGFGLLFDAAAEELGVRIVSPDRPGYGRSDPDPHRTILDWPDDVAALADALGLDRFGVIGVSGGGPYAAACAYALPDRVRATALVSAVGPPDAPKSLGMRVLLRLVRLVPWLAGIPVRRQLERARSDPEAAIEARASGKAPAEVAMHRSDAGRRLNAQTAEAGRQGWRQVAHETGLAGGSWGFDLADIGGPVRVWHGGSDRTIQLETGAYVADAIPNAELTVYEDEGHLSLPVNSGEEILAFVAEP